MTLKYGFYGSVNHDRVYTADEFSAFLDGIVYDGVYNAIGDLFYITTTAVDNQLQIGPGRAWFNHTWTWNDRNYILEPTYIEEGVTYEHDVPLPSNTGYRIDAVVIEVNKDNRENYFKIVQGTEVPYANYDPNDPSTFPVRPQLIGKNPDGSTDITYEGNVFQYALAYIFRPISSERAVILQSDITFVVGDESGQTPIVSALALAGIPSGGTIGQVLAKESDTSGHVGWHTVTKLPTNKWYLPTGVEESNVIGAWKFKGAASEVDALQNINSETTYELTKSSQLITWSAGAGFYIPSTSDIGLDNTDLHKIFPIGTVAVKYANASTESNAMVGVFGTNIANNSYTRAMFIRISNRNKPGISLNNSASTQYRYCLYETDTISNAEAASGIIVGNFGDTTPAMYFNGISCALTSVNSGSATHLADNARWTKIFGQCKPNGSVTYGNYYIHAAVIFNRNLSADEIAHLTTLMEAI